MKEKFFQKEQIPEEIQRFYDDLAIKYLKSDYEVGREAEGEIKSEKIGRYLMSQTEIYLIEPNIDLNFLLHCEEGYKKQDELVIFFDKFIRIKDLKEILFEYSGEILDISGLPFIQDNKQIELKDKKLSVELSPAGIYIACHVFGISKLKKLLNKVEIHCKDNIPITEYLDNKSEYDISYITGVLKEKKVIPKVNEKDKSEIDIGEEFIGQNSKGLKEQIKEILPILEKLKNLTQSKKEELIENKNSNEELIEKIKEIIKDNNRTKARLVEDSDSVREKLKEKFEKEYGDKKYTNYFEDVTNSKVDSKERKSFNEILKAVDKKNKDIINQENFDKYRDILKKQVSVIDFLYDICSSSMDPLQTLEDSLCFLSCKYENESRIQQIGNIIKNIFKSKVKEYIVNKIEDFTKIKLENSNTNYLTSLGLADVDDIKVDCPTLPLREYPKTKHYKFLKLFKDECLVKKSYSLDKQSKRNFKRARRFLDNLLISLIKSITRVKTKYFDNFPNDKQNILRNYLIYLDEYRQGLDFSDYSFLASIKDFNITNVIISLLKSDKEYKDKSLQKISNLMENKDCKTYLKDGSASKIKKSFKTKQALAYNMKIRSSYNIYNFYEKIYFEVENNEKNKIVCSGAKVSCTMSPDISTLNVLSAKKYIDGKACATIYDNRIIPFKTCTINKVCSPNLSYWLKKTDIQIENKPILLENSKCICTLGGTINITNPNQIKSSLKQIPEIKTEIIYKLDDYKAIENIYSRLERRYFNKYARYVYSVECFARTLAKQCEILFKSELKPRYDEKKLMSYEVYPVVDSKNERLINIKPLAKIIMGYFLGKINSKYENDKWVNIGKKLCKQDVFSEFIEKAKKQLPQLYSPYKISTNENRKCTWMERALFEYMKSYNQYTLQKMVKIYHKEGGGIDADINTPWCASFVNYILNLGFKSPSSQCFYSKEGAKYFKKINKAKYGAILVLNYGNGKGHCSFIVSEDDNGYYCLGGNQSNVIKKSYYKKDKKVQGIYWPR